MNANDRSDSRFCNYSLLTLTLGAAFTPICWVATASAMELPNLEAEVRPVSTPVRFHGMYIDANNQVHVANTRSTIPVVEAVEFLLQGDRSTTELRDAALAMRKRMTTLNAEIRGTQLAANRLQDQRIALNRQARTNEQFRRIPGTSNSERTQQSERSNGRERERSRVLTLSPEEEEAEKTAALLGFHKVPRRYSSGNFDSESVRVGLKKVEQRLEKNEASLEQLKAMKIDVASSIIRIDCELTDRKRVAVASSIAATKMLREVDPASSPQLVVARSEANVDTMSDQ